MRKLDLAPPRDSPQRSNCAKCSHVIEREHRVNGDRLRNSLLIAMKPASELEAVSSSCTNEERATSGFLQPHKLPSYVRRGARPFQSQCHAD
jgi:hypothetical protein